MFTVAVSGVKEFGVSAKSTEYSKRTIVMLQWVPDWRCTDTERFSWQGKCHPRYRQWPANVLQCYL